MAISGRWRKSGRPPSRVQTSAAAVVVVVLVLLYCIYYKHSHIHTPHTLLYTYTCVRYITVLYTHYYATTLAYDSRTDDEYPVRGRRCVRESLVHKLRNAQVYLWAAKLPYARAPNKSSWSRRCRLSTTDAHTRHLCRYYNACI